MRVRHFFAVCLASMVWSGSANLSLLACEQCESSHVCNACCQSDDRGLLDRIDSALQRRQPNLQRVCLPQLPSLRGNCGWGTAASCGCELSRASCGCEIAPANCGAELSVLDGQPAEQLQWSSKALSQADVPSPQIASDAFQPRQKPVQHAPATPQVTPLPQHIPAEMIPAPDSESDPFRDDSARVLRRVPVQSIQLRPSGSAYRQSYDPQARHESARKSLSDHSLPGQRPDPTSLSQHPRTKFDTHGSSRQGSFAPETQPSSQRQLPAVVTASGLATSGYEQQALRVSSRPKNGEGGLRASGLRGSGLRGSGLDAGGVEIRAEERQPAVGFNPLRSSRSQ